MPPMSSESSLLANDLYKEEKQYLWRKVMAQKREVFLRVQKEGGVLDPYTKSNMLCSATWYNCGQFYSVFEEDMCPVQWQVTTKKFCLSLKLPYGTLDSDEVLNHRELQG